MTVNKVDSNILNFHRPNGYILSPSINSQPSLNSDVVELKNSKKKRMITYSGIVAGLLLLLGIFNHKKIAKMFSKKQPEINIPTSSPSSTSRVAEAPQTVKVVENASSIGNIEKEAQQSDLVEEFYRLRREWHNSSLKDPKREELKAQTNSLKSELIEKNISFVPKHPEKFETKEAQIKFIQDRLFDDPFNEATALEVMDVFEKYGSRYTYGVENCSDAMDNLSLFMSSVWENLPKESANKVYTKYLDLFDKFADITPPKNNDTRHLNSFLQNHSDKMNADTIIKHIETLKKWSFEQSSANYIKMYVFDSPFNTRSTEELARLKKHFNELNEIIKDLPFEDKTRIVGA